MPRGGGGRSSSGGRSSGGSSFSRASPSRSTATASRPVQHAPTPVQQAPASSGMGMGGGLMGTMATGMAFGAGSEIAHQAVRGMMGGGSGHGSTPAQQAAPDQGV